MTQQIMLRENKRFLSPQLADKAVSAMHYNGGQRTFAKQTDGDSGKSCLRFLFIKNFPTVHKLFMLNSGGIQIYGI